MFKLLAGIPLVGALVLVAPAWAHSDGTSQGSQSTSSTNNGPSPPPTSVQNSDTNYVNQPTTEAQQLNNTMNQQ
jgi:hypothetical protein